MYPEGLRYDKEHVWVRADGDIAVIGVTDYAQDQLGEVVYVDLPAVGDTTTGGDTFGEIESVKSVSDLYCPVTGEVVKVNEELDTAPETVNDDCYGTGWMIEVRMSDPTELDGLMSAAEYSAFISGEE